MMSTSSMTAAPRRYCPASIVTERSAMQGCGSNDQAQLYRQITERTGRADTPFARASVLSRRRGTVASGASRFDHASIRLGAACGAAPMAAGPRRLQMPVAMTDTVLERALVT